MNRSSYRNLHRLRVPLEREIHHFAIKQPRITRTYSPNAAIFTGFYPIVRVLPGPHRIDCHNPGPWPWHLNLATVVHVKPAANSITQMVALTLG